MSNSIQLQRLSIECPIIGRVVFELLSREDMGLREANAIAISLPDGSRMFPADGDRQATNGISTPMLLEFSGLVLGLAALQSVGKWLEEFDRNRKNGG
jgi:hypothetical protein